MNGSPAKMGTIQGTAGYSSVLKMKVEENASALKQKTYGGAGKTWGEYNKASGGALNTDTKTQKEYEAKMRKENPNWDKKKDNTWKTQQNKINKHVGSKVVHTVDEIANDIKNNTIVDEVKKEVKNAVEEFVTSPNTSTKLNLSKEELDKKFAKQDKRLGERNETHEKAIQKGQRQTAEEDYGKDSSKYQKERIEELVAKRSDRMGGEGGKKQMWGLRQINNLGGNIRTKNALKRGLKARAKEEAAAKAAGATT